jgi:hypothetical protein
MGKFKKGVSGNPGGRPRGSKNKTPDQLRQMVKNFIFSHWSEIEAEFSDLEPKDKMTFIDRLLRHVLPPPLSLDNLTTDQLMSIISQLENENGNKSTT